MEKYSTFFYIFLGFVLFLCLVIYYQSDAYDLKCTDFWFNISSHGNYQEYHQHANSHFSVVYYVNSPKNCGNIVFEDSSNNVVDLLYRNQKIKEDNKMFENYYYNVKEGLMILFPSNLMHRVEQNQSDEDRISISFNLI